MLKNNFNGGIFSNYLRYRADLEKYQFSVADLHNMVVMPYGGVEKRNGTHYVADFDKKSDIRLASFQFSNTEKYLLVFMPQSLRIFKGQEEVAFFSTRFKSVENLSFEQKNDYFFIASPDVFPHVLKRFNDKEWELAEYNLKHRVFKEHEGDFNVNVYKSDHLKYIISSSQKFFTSAMVGAQMRLKYQKKIFAVNETFTEEKHEDPSTAMQIQGAWRLLSTGSWEGTVILEKRNIALDGNWQIVRTYSSNANNNIDTSGFEREYGFEYRVRYENWNSAPSGVLYECKITLSVDDNEDIMLVKLKKYVSDYKCEVEILQGVYNDENEIKESVTDNWEIEAWNDEYGYPSTVAFTSGDRLAFAGTQKQPQTVWLSAVSDYNNFYNDTQADSALTWTIATNLYNSINWILNTKKLLIGLSNQIGILKAKNENEPLTIDNREYLPEIDISASHLQPVRIGEAMLLLRRGNQTLLELSYDWEAEGYVAPDMTLLAPDILESGVVQYAYQKLPYPVVWFVLANGNLVSFTYNRGENVTAWARHSSNGGLFKSVAILENDNNSDDVYFAVERNGRYYIELMAKNGEDIYTDCTVKLAPVSKGSDVQLKHIKSAEAALVIDGGAYSVKVNSEGRFTMPERGSIITCGYAVKSYLETLPFEMMNGNESTLANKKICQNLLVKFHKSVGGEFSLDGKNYSKVISRNIQMPIDSGVEPKSVTADLSLKSSYQYETAIYFRHDLPLPLTLLAFEIDMMI